MQQTTATANSPTISSFASMLAALATPAQKPGDAGEESFRTARRFSSAGSDDGLEDDIATLSYERALKAHARYRAPNQSLSHHAGSDVAGVEVSTPAPSAAVAQPQTHSAPVSQKTGLIQPATDADAESYRCRATPFERNLKSASITIRLSKTEYAQLHRRAADAGLTVSAYLRSCTFEAESLRAMVKDTLAELRLAKAQSKPADPVPPRRSSLRRVADWTARLFAPWHGNQRVARA